MFDKMKKEGVQSVRPERDLKQEGEGVTKQKGLGLPRDRETRHKAWQK